MSHESGTRSISGGLLRGAGEAFADRKRPGVGQGRNGGVPGSTIKGEAMARDPAGMQERRNRIIETLKADGFVMVTNLARTFGTTEVTIRSDLQALEKEGRLRRMAGGAVPAQLDEQASPDVPRVTRCAAEKRRIAAFAAKLIPDGERLFINSGRTTYVFA